MGKQAVGQWRPLVASNTATSTHSSRPLAPVGEPSPPKSDARSIDLPHILPSYSLSTKQLAPTSESQHTPGPEPEKDFLTEEPRKLIAQIPDAILATLRSTCAAKAEVSLLGRIHGKHPGLKALTTWARDTLHPSLSFLSLKTNNLFEVTFTHPEGRIHALTQTNLICDTATILFSSWRPHFDSKAPQAEESLDHPVWVQIVDLCQVLREEPFLKLIGEQIGQVISIDNSEAYRSKLFGPRIRLLVQDLHQLPQTVVIPRLDGEGTVEYPLEYSGLPNQCGRCRSHDHLVRNCPRKFPPLTRKKDIHNKNKIVETKSESIQVAGAFGDTNIQKPGPQDQEQEQESTQVKKDNTNVVAHETPPKQATLQQVPDTQGGEGEDAQQQPLATPEIASTPVHSANNNSSVGQTDFDFTTLQPDDINFPKLQSPTPMQHRQQEQERATRSTES